MPKKPKYPHAAHAKIPKRPGAEMLLMGALVLAVLGGLAYVSWARMTDSELPPPPEDAVYKQADAPVEARVNDLLAYMTLDEKIGQMSLVDKNSLQNVKDIKHYGLGALLSGAGAKPRDNTPAGWGRMIDEFQLATENTRLRIPLLYGLDAIHGHTNVPGATVFPHFIGLGAANDKELTKAVAQATASELTATHVNWSYSPTLDAPKDIRWGRVYETFSDDPVLNGEHGMAYIEGLQYSSEAGDTLQLLATAKHFLGVGAMQWGHSENKDFRIDQGVTPADEEALRSEYLPPFEAAVQAGAASVMVGLNKWGDGTVITNKSLLTGALKEDLGFDGIVVSDWYGVYERAGNKYDATVRSVNAGLDMAMLPFEYKIFARDVRKAVAKRDIPPERIDDAVRRILRQKFRAGLFDRPLTGPVDAAELGKAEHRALAREAVAKSAVLLKNENATLPLSTDVKRIAVAGSGADNVGRQSGAWTVEWQGIDGNWLPGSTSILQGIRSQVSPDTAVQYDEKGNFHPGQQKAEVGIAIISEKPYAEGWGDNPAPAIDAADVQAIERLRAVSERVVVVTVSGRPLLLYDQPQAWDALVAVWLPGSEGGGVADVLFGNRKFTGKLPLPWPAKVEQLPFGRQGNSTDGTAPLFPRGFGLE